MGHADIRIETRNKGWRRMVKYGGHGEDTSRYGLPKAFALTFEIGMPLPPLKSVLLLLKKLLGMRLLALFAAYPDWHRRFTVFVLTHRQHLVAKFSPHGVRRSCGQRRDKPYRADILFLIVEVDPPYLSSVTVQVLPLFSPFKDTAFRNISGLGQPISRIHRKLPGVSS